MMSVIALLCAGLGPAAGQEVRQDLWMTDGVVNASAVSGDVLYLAGRFEYVGPRTGSGVSIDAATGQVASLPRVGSTSGSVHTVIPDGAGGWYIGGSFSQVNGVARSDIAHVLADNSLDPWNPGCDGWVNVLLASGSTIYVGGNFSSFGGQARANLAAFDATTGAVTSWNPGAAGLVLTMATNGSTVFVGGDFTSIGGQSRAKIAAVDAATGAVTSWNPAPNLPGGDPWTVRCLAVSGSVVYAGGGFTSIGFQFRNRLAALDATTGAATAWNPNPNTATETTALAVEGSTVYVGGNFSTIGGQDRNKVAAVDAATGNATAWNPDAGLGSVYCFAIQGSTVYVGGIFNRIGGQSRLNLAALDAVTGSATAWNPTANANVYAIAASGARVFAGGAFQMAGGVPRNRAAALDLTTGMATDWNPNIEGTSPYVHALAVSGSTVYLGGSFTFVGGQIRNYIAAVDKTTGVPTSWNPNASFTVNALAVSGSNVYVGGQFFTSIGGQPRAYLAAVDATTGKATAWTPAPNGPVLALAVSGPTLYAGGQFTNIGGQARSRIAALDATTANATAWDPTAGSDVYALAVDGSTIYVGGGFAFVGGAARSRIAALDAATGAATPWNPGSDQLVRALASNGSEVFAGGSFHNIGGQPRDAVAALDKATGTATAWNPDPGAIGTPVVFTLSQSGTKVYLGGDFRDISNGTLPITNLAGVDKNTVVVEAPAAGPPRLSLVARPNPFDRATEIEFVLPREAIVTLGVFDVTGREVARLADARRFEAGPHRLRFEARGMVAGLYFFRLTAGDLAITRRIVLVR